MVGYNCRIQPWITDLNKNGPNCSNDANHVINGMTITKNASVEKYLTNNLSSFFIVPGAFGKQQCRVMLLTKRITIHDR